MSMYWGYYCEACDVESEHWYNHGEDKLREVYAAWPHVRAIRELAGGNIDVSVLGQGTPWPFLEEHPDHPLMLINEYGDLEPLNPDAVTRGFTLRLEVSGIERTHIQEMQHLTTPPDGGWVRRFYGKLLDEALHKRIQYDYEMWQRATDR
jgi:hypothetical protein